MGTPGRQILSSFFFFLLGTSGAKFFLLSFLREWARRAPNSLCCLFLPSRHIRAPNSFLFPFLENGQVSAPNSLFFFFFFFFSFLLNEAGDFCLRLSKGSTPFQ